MEYTVLDDKYSKTEKERDQLVELLKQTKQQFVDWQNQQNEDAEK